MLLQKFRCVSIVCAPKSKPHESKKQNEKGGEKRKEKKKQPPLRSTMFIITIGLFTQGLDPQTATNNTPNCFTPPKK